MSLPELLDRLISKISFVSTYRQLVNMKQFWKDGIISVIRSLEINLPKILCISTQDYKMLFNKYDLNK